MLPDMDEVHTNHETNPLTWPAADEVEEQVLFFIVARNTLKT
jgi:hypothetical protein